MAPLEPWERIWIDAELFTEDVHSYINCTECHGGEAVDDMTEAHDGMVVEAVNSPETCGRCHVDVGPTGFNSLHNSLQGYDTALYARSAPEHYEALEEMEVESDEESEAPTENGEEARAAKKAKKAIRKAANKEKLKDCKKVLAKFGKPPS